jgi:hypothetical protein
MLEDFKEFFTEELPTRIPPLHNISHQIDLILGSILPNEALYRISPSESEEVN